MVDLAVVLAVGSPFHNSHLTYNRPRAMLPVLGKPMVVRNMERLYRAGIHNYVVVVGEDEGAVASYLHAQWLPDVKIDFVVQPPTSSLPRILADIARRYARPFLITAYNSFTHINFPDRLLNLHHDLGGSLTLSGAPISLSRATPGAYALVEKAVVKAVLREKSDAAAHALINLAVCGEEFVSYLSTLVLNTGLFSKQLLDIVALYVVAGGKTRLAETPWVLQIEADYDLLTLNRHLLEEDQDTHILSELPGSIHITAPVRIDPSVSIGQGARIGPRVYLESGCSIGANATVADAMVLQNSVVPGGSSVVDVIVATRARIHDPNKS